MFVDALLPADVNTTEFGPPPPPADAFLTQLQREISAYTTSFLQEHITFTSDLRHTTHRSATRLRRRGRRRRRQVVTPDMEVLRNAYSTFLGPGGGRPPARSRKRNRLGGGGGGGAELPVVLVPEEDQTQCVASSRLSTFGFLGFVLNVINAVINVANNIDNNNNSNNNNDNNNNNNDLNANQAQVTQTATNTNTAMTVGRRLALLKAARSTLRRNLRRLQRHHTRQRRSSPESCGGGGVVEEAVVAGAALLDMWGRLVTEEDPWRIAREMCHTSSVLTATSRLAGSIGQVGAVAAANMLVNFQGVNPDFLVAAAAERDCETLSASRSPPQPAQHNHHHHLLLLLNNTHPDEHI